MALTTYLLLAMRLEARLSYASTAPLGLHGRLWLQFTFVVYLKTLALTPIISVGLQAKGQEKKWKEFRRKTLWLHFCGAFMKCALTD
jgi:hypothetical protein